MAALVAFVVLMHTQAHARGERKSAGPGVEYLIGNDGLLYQCQPVKVQGKVRYQAVQLPGVHPDHVDELLKSPNIKRVSSYNGPVFQLNGKPGDNSTGDNDRALVVALTKERDDLRVENARLKEEGRRLQAENARLSAAQAQPASPSAPPAPPQAEPPPPPVLPPSAPPVAESLDIPAILGLSVSKLGASLAAGDYDGILTDLREAEAAGKNRTGALSVIDARIDALNAPTT